MNVEVTFARESPISTYVIPSRGYRKGLYEVRVNAIQGIVVHTTGLEPVSLWERAKKDPAASKIYTTPFDMAAYIYSNKMNAGGHYLIGQERGQIAQLCPEGICAWHVGAKDGLLKLRSAALIYGKPQSKWVTDDTRWWPSRWEGLFSPRDLMGGRLWDPYGIDPRKLRTRILGAHGSVNANTLGFDVVPPSTDPRVPWTEDCWRNIAALAIDCSRRNEFPVERERVISHSDAHPRARSKKGRPWDPSPEQWSWSKFAQYAGIKEAA